MSSGAERGPQAPRMVGNGPVAALVGPSAISSLYPAAIPSPFRRLCAQRAAPPSTRAGSPSSSSAPPENDGRNVFVSRPLAACKTLAVSMRALFLPIIPPIALRASGGKLASLAWPSSLRPHHFELRHGHSAANATERPSPLFPQPGPARGVWAATAFSRWPLVSPAVRLW